MEILKKYGKWIVLVLLLALVLILWYNNKRLRQEKDSIIIAHNAEVQANLEGMQKMYSIITKNGDTIKYQKQVTISQDNAIRMGILREEDLKNRHLKSIEYITELQEEIKILKKPGEYVTPPVVQQFDSASWMKLPARLEFLDTWYSINVTATDCLPMLDSLKIVSRPVLTHAMYKEPGLKHIFKAPYPVVTYTNENPYIKATGMNSYQFKDEKKWYQTTGAKVGAGALLGLTVSKLLTK